MWCGLGEVKKSQCMSYNPIFGWIFSDLANTKVCGGGGEWRGDRRGCSRWMEDGQRAAPEVDEQGVGGEAGTQKFLLAPQ